jgi:hypothetical protein
MDNPSNSNQMTAVSNGDETSVAPVIDGDTVRYIGNFHKTLPHNEFGEVVAADYDLFVAACDTIESTGLPGTLESVPRGVASGTMPFFPNVPASICAGPFINPMAGGANESVGPDPKSMNMISAPSVLSNGAAAEMVELYWMALLRDVPFADFGTNADVAAALADVRTCYLKALASESGGGAVKLGTDLPQTAGGALDINPQTLFRSALPGEQYGPLVSQFFLNDANFGTQKILQDQIPYRAHLDFLTEYKTWLLAQSTGYDRHGRDYPNANHYSDYNGYYEPDLQRRRMRTMRDLARFVNRDALHQAYFNAALMLLSWKAPFDAGNPYGTTFTRSVGFGTLGGPHLLTLVSEVASRALKVVWRQKWLVHRRLRPEAYGGLLHMQEIGLNGNTRAYGLPSWLPGTAAATRIRAETGGLFLPMAFSAGSPAHPAYGAGHATVAGACVTILKAWFKEDQTFAGLFAEGQHGPQEPGASVHCLRMPDREGSPHLPVFRGPDADKITVGGELNKLASNVAMGRSMGGVHWRTDNTRSLRLGEAVATEILRRQSQDYVETPFSCSFLSFDGKKITIEDGKALEDGVELPTPIPTAPILIPR